MPNRMAYFFCSKFDSYKKIRYLCQQFQVKHFMHSNIQMRILFVTRGFPSKENFMSGNYEAVQAQAIAAKGHDVSVIAIKWKNPLHILERNRVNHRP